MTSALAGCTIESGAIALLDTLDRALAAFAGLGLPAINIQLNGKIASLLMGIREVPESRAANLNGFCQDTSDGGAEHICSGAAQAAGDAPGVNVCAKESFAGVDVAHSDDDTGVHDVLLDGALTAATGSVKTLFLESIGQGFRAQMGQQGVSCQILFLNRLQQAKAARIDVAQNTTVIEEELGMGVSGTIRGGGDDEAPAHSEVAKKDAFPVGGNDQVLCTAVHPDQGAAAQQASHGAPVQGIAQFRCMECHPDQGSPAEERFQAAARGFDFREFRHEGSGFSGGESFQVFLKRSHPCLVLCEAIRCDGHAPPLEGIFEGCGGNDLEVMKNCRQDRPVQPGG